jgi:hypothetical protein
MHTYDLHCKADVQLEAKCRSTLELIQCSLERVPDIFFASKDKDAYPLSQDNEEDTQMPSNHNIIETSEESKMRRGDLQALSQLYIPVSHLNDNRNYVGQESNSSDDSSTSNVTEFHLPNPFHLWLIFHLVKLLPLKTHRNVTDSIMTTLSLLLWTMHRRNQGKGEYLTLGLDFIKLGSGWL